MEFPPIMSLVLVEALGKRQGTKSADLGPALAAALFVKPSILGLLLAVGLERNSAPAGGAQSSSVSAVQSVTTNLALGVSPIGAPTNLKHKHPGNNKTDVDLYWTASPTAGVTYVVYRYQRDTEAWISFIPAPPNSLSLSQENLPANKEFIYLVRAKDSSGKLSDDSNLTFVRTS